MPLGVQGGNAPLKKLYIILKIEIPLPYQQATLAHSFLLREGGERAPVALCREPTEPAGETGVGSFPCIVSSKKEAPPFEKPDYKAPAGPRVSLAAAYPHAPARIQQSLQFIHFQR